jgi:hypothetical protein
MALNWPVPRLRMLKERIRPAITFLPIESRRTVCLSRIKAGGGAVPTCYSVGQPKNRRNEPETDFLTGLRVCQPQLKVKGGT